MKYLKILLVLVAISITGTAVQAAEPPMEGTIMDEIQCAIDPICYPERVHDLRLKAYKARTFTAWMSVYCQASRLGKDRIRNRAVHGMKMTAENKKQKDLADWYASRI